MTAALFTGPAGRFPLGTPRGFTPTTEPVSDTAVTPFGLTLRTMSRRGNLAVVRTADGTIMMATEKVTEITSDGSGSDEDVRFDVTDD